jgi:hypothetical protein
MAEPAMKQAPGKEQAEVKQIQLTPKATESRAIQAYNAAVKTVVSSVSRNTDFNEEFKVFSDMVKSRQGSGFVDVGQVLGQYANQYPDSTLTKYARLFKWSTEWLLSPKNKLEFQPKVFERLLKEYLGDLKNKVVDALITLNAPSKNQVAIPVGSLDSDLVSTLQAELSVQFTGKLPVTVAYAAQELVIKSTLQGPTREDVVTDEEARRGG